MGMGGGGGGGGKGGGGGTQFKILVLESDAMADQAPPRV